MLLFFLACTDPLSAEDPYADLAFPPAGPEHAPDASDWGPFPVGVTTLWLTDPDRTLEDGSPRIVPVEVWYPAASAEGELRTYAVADFVPEVRLKVEDIDPDDLPWLTSSSLETPEADTAHGPYPLVVFSHGNGGMRLQSLFFTEYLASHGYVVASPDHIGNTLADLLIPGENEFSSTADSFLYRPDDVRMVVERLRGADDPAPVSAGDWGIAGHSLGAWTALHAAGEEEGVAVTIAQAPPDIQLALAGTGTAPDELDMPVMIQAGTADQILDYATNADASFDLMAPPSLMATYFDAGHFTFSDLCILELGVVQDLIEDSVGNVMQDGCGPENPDVETILPLLRFHAIGLINATLRDSPVSEAAMLAGPGEELESFFELEVLR